MQDNDFAQSAHRHIPSGPIPAIMAKILDSEPAPSIQLSYYTTGG